MAENYGRQDLNIGNKIYIFLENIWPSVYKTVNSLLWGIWNFLIDTLSGLWRRY